MAMSKKELKKMNENLKKSSEDLKVYEEAAEELNKKIESFKKSVKGTKAVIEEMKNKYKRGDTTKAEYENMKATGKIHIKAFKNEIKNLKIDLIDKNRGVIACKKEVEDIINELQNDPDMSNLIKETQREKVDKEYDKADKKIEKLKTDKDKIDFLANEMSSKPRLKNEMDGLLKARNTINSLESEKKDIENNIKAKENDLKALEAKTPRDYDLENKVKSELYDLKNRELLAKEKEISKANKNFQKDSKDIITSYGINNGRTADQEITEKDFMKFTDGKIVDKKGNIKSATKIAKGIIKDIEKDIKKTEQRKDEYALAKNKYGEKRIDYDQEKINEEIDKYADMYADEALKVEEIATKVYNNTKEKLENDFQNASLKEKRAQIKAATGRNGIMNGVKTFWEAWTQKGEGIDKINADIEKQAKTSKFDAMNRFEQLTHRQIASIKHAERGQEKEDIQNFKDSIHFDGKKGKEAKKLVNKIAKRKIKEDIDDEKSR